MKEENKMENINNNYFVIEHSVNCYYGEIGDVFTTIKFFGNHDECQNYVNNNNKDNNLYIVKFGETLEINY